MSDVIEMDNGSIENNEAHDAEMVAMPVAVRDGDDLITFDEEEEVEDQSDDGEANDDDNAEPDDDKDDIPTDYEEAAAKLDEGQAGFEQMKEQALARGVSAETMTAMEAEFEQNGSLSDASYEALANAGYPRSFVDSFIAGQTALANAYVNGFVQSVGGQEALDAIVKTLETSAPGMEQMLANAVANRDHSQAKTLVALAGSLQAANARVKQEQHTQRFGQPAQRSITERGVQQAAVRNTGYANQGEMIAAMSNPLYGRDAQYTREVEQKVANSPW